MGMCYTIIPNKQTKCANDFGTGLSFFFEKMGGYEETTEVAPKTNQFIKI